MLNLTALLSRTIPPLPEGKTRVHRIADAQEEAELPPEPAPAKPRPPRPQYRERTSKDGRRGPLKGAVGAWRIPILDALTNEWLEANDINARILPSPMPIKNLQWRLQRLAKTGFVEKISVPDPDYASGAIIINYYRKLQE